MGIISTTERLENLKVLAAINMAKSRHKAGTVNHLKQYVFKDVQTSPVKAGTGKRARTLRPQKDFSSSDSNEESDSF